MSFDGIYGIGRIGVLLVQNPENPENPVFPVSSGFGGGRLLLFAQKVEVDRGAADVSCAGDQHLLS